MSKRLFNYLFKNFPDAFTRILCTIWILAGFTSCNPNSLYLSGNRIVFRAGLITRFSITLLLALALTTWLTGAMANMPGKQAIPGNIDMTGVEGASDLDRPPADDEVDYHPADNEVTVTNPPAFNWLTVGEADSYIVQYSTSPSFTPTQTTTVRNIDMVVHVPTEILNPGTWYWRYGYTSDGTDLLSRTRRFVIPENAVHFPLVTGDEFIKRIPRHRPRLYFSPGLVEEVRSDVSGKYENVKVPVIREAEIILEMNEPLMEEFEPYENTEDPVAAYVEARNLFFPYSGRMFTCALAYIYSGDRRFAEEARRRLMGMMRWDVDGVSTAVRRDGLAMWMAENGVAVFDWIYDILSEEERQICKEILTARMVQINHGVHRARSMESRPFASHAGRFIGFVIEGGIVLAHEAPEARDWIDYTLRLLWSTYPAWGGHEGGWQEGVSYWTGYMLRMVRVVLELDIYGIPLKDKPFFRNTGYFGLYVAYPGRPTSAFGDLHHNPVGRSSGLITRMLANLYNNSYFQWHYEEAASLASGREAARILNSAVEATPPVDLPQSKMFEDVGIVAMHSNMAEPDNNVLMLFKSNPFGAISHSHASQNAFIIEAFKEPLAISTGYRQTHANLHHREWIWQTKAHNSILVDGEGQLPRDRNANGKIIDYLEHGDYVYSVGDATRAYGGRMSKFHRHIVFVRPGYFVIIDDLETSGSSSSYQWLLHSPERMQVDDVNRVVVSSSGNARLTARFLDPGNIELKQHTGFAPPVKDPVIPPRSTGPTPDQFHLTVSTTGKSTSQRFVTVLWVDRVDSMLTALKGMTGGQHREAVKESESGNSAVKILENRGIADNNLLTRVMQDAELIDARGGVALRVGDDLVLWKEESARRIRAAGTSSRKAMEVRIGFFKIDN